MERLIVTQTMADAAHAAGACLVPKVGTLISALSQAHIRWAERNMPDLYADTQAMMQAPLWSITKSGSGFWSGYGFGSGGEYGYGDGDGYGCGDGYGSGEGGMP